MRVTIDALISVQLYNAKEKQDQSQCWLLFFFF